MKQLAVWLHTGQLPLQVSSTRAPMKSSRPLLHPHSHTSSAATSAAGRWKGLQGIGRLLFMIKRVLVSGAVVVGAALLACGGGSSDLQQKPQIVTDRDAIQADICRGLGGPQSVFVQNKGIEDLVVSSLTLTAVTPGVLTSQPPVFRLQVNQVLNAQDGGINNTIKSNNYGLVSMYFNAIDAGTYDAQLTIASNAQNAPTKVIPLRVFSPDAGS